MDQLLTFPSLPTVLLSGTHKVEKVQSCANIDCQTIAYADGIGNTGTLHSKIDYAYAFAIGIVRGLAKWHLTPANQAAVVQS